MKLLSLIYLKNSTNPLQKHEFIFMLYSNSATHLKESL